VLLPQLVGEPGLMLAEASNEWFFPAVVLNHQLLEMPEALAIDVTRGQALAKSVEFRLDSTVFFRQGCDGSRHVPLANRQCVVKLRAAAAYRLQPQHFP